jgi:hypothetical protein
VREVSKRALLRAHALRLLFAGRRRRILRERLPNELQAFVRCFGIGADGESAA